MIEGIVDFDLVFELLYHFVLFDRAFHNSFHSYDQACCLVSEIKKYLPSHVDLPEFSLS